MNEQEKLDQEVKDYESGLRAVSTLVIHSGKNVGANIRLSFDPIGNIFVNGIEYAPIEKPSKHEEPDEWRRILREDAKNA